MQTKRHKQPAAPSRLTVGLVSLGCAKNLVDSQVMTANLLGAGLELAAAPEQADVVLINTCAFIHDAREESIEAILDACRLKETGPCRAVVVSGCLPQRYRLDLQEALPEVDAFVGLDRLDRVAEIVRAAAAGAAPVVDVPARSRRLFEPAQPALSLTGGPFAYIKIAEGCNHPCAFCAIPGIRGRRRSRPVASIVREAAALLEAGYRELNLVAQDTTSYGRDRRDGASLPALLRALGRLGGTFWIRLLYGYPSRVDEALLAAMAETPQVCRYLDIPVQHSHPDILRAMRRANTIRAVATLPQRLRAALPGVVLRTTCLVGYPGETPAHVAHLLDYVRDAAFDHLGVFAFSPEEGTPAAAMRPRPRLSTAEQRRQQVLLAQQAVVARRARALRGERAVALLERPAGPAAAWIGRTQRQAPDVDGVTRIEGVPAHFQAGDWLPVCYTGRRGNDLLAVAVGGAGDANGA